MDDGIIVVKSSVKSPPGLCSFLFKKKRVGCLPMKAAGSFDVCKREKKSDESSFSMDEEGLEMEGNNSHIKTGINANMPLCCASADQSSTPSHTCSVINEANSKIQLLQEMEEFQSRSRIKNPINRLHSLLKINSETNLMSSLSGSTKKLTLRKSRSQKRSLSLSKGAFPTSDNDVSLLDKSLDVNSSLDNSPVESPNVLRSSNRRRLFFSQERKSIDVVPPSSSGSSPASVRSFRTTDSKQKRKGRPFSVAVMDRNESSLLKGKTASADSLALQSLLAAQVLHLIPVDKARERNYLHGRIATNSLLGNIELSRVLPHKEVTIYVCSWNMNGQAPPGQLNSLMLPNDISHVPDIVAVGTQESYSERFLWEVALQETLGPSHVLFHSAALGTLHLAIFLRRDLIWFCSLGDEGSYSVRPGTAFKTKGAVGIAFYLFGTNFLFLTCHLTAHQDKTKERITDIKRITRSLELPKILPLRYKSKDVTDNFDNVFWFGDLNFRVGGARKDVIDWVSKQTFPTEGASQILESDQLNNIIAQGNVLKGFKEGKVNFPPTYKFDVGSQTYDSSSKERTPSYTDRILFKSRRESSLNCLEYTSVNEICTSDHKPVWALFNAVIRPGIDTIPLAAGHFNREVYLEAIKRRAAAMEYKEDVSTICSIQ